MFTPSSVQCFTPRTGLPTGNTPLENRIHYVVKVLVACSANYCHSACNLIVPTLAGYWLRTKSYCIARGDATRTRLAHPFLSESYEESASDGVGLVAHLLSPSPPTAKSGLVGVPRSLDGDRFIPEWKWRSSDLVFQKSNWGCHLTVCGSPDADNLLDSQLGFSRRVTGLLDCAWPIAAN
jgi:hypothetical protein